MPGSVPGPLSPTAGPPVPGLARHGSSEAG